MNKSFKMSLFDSIAHVECNSNQLVENVTSILKFSTYISNNVNLYDNLEKAYGWINLIFYLIYGDVLMICIGSI